MYSAYIYDGNQLLFRNMTYLHCLQHSLFEHIFNLYCETEVEFTFQRFKWHDDGTFKALLCVLCFFLKKNDISFVLANGIS